MRLSRPALLVCLALLPVPAGCGSSPPAPAPIPIAAVGDFAGAGAGALRSMEVAVELANRSGGAFGHRLTLWVADDGGEAGRGVDEAERVCLDQSVMAAVSPASEAASGAVSRVLYGCGVALILTGPRPDPAPAGPAAASPSAFDNAVHLTPAAADQGSLIGAWIRRALHPGKAYLLDDGTQPDLSAALRASLVADGVRVAVDHLAGGPVAAAGRAAAAAPGAVLLALSASRAASFLASARRDGLAAPAVGGPDLFGSADLLVQGRGPTYLAALAPNPTAAAPYLDAYRARFGSAAGFDPVAVEGVLLAVSAVLESDGYPGLDRGTVITGVRRPDGFAGIYGAPLAFDSRGELEGGGLWIYRLTAGGPAFAGAA